MKVLPPLFIALCAVAFPATAADTPYFPALVKGDTWAYHLEQGIDESAPKVTLNGVEVLGKNDAGQFLLAGFNPKIASDKQIMDILRTMDADACVMDPFHGTILRRGARCERPPKKGEIWHDDLKIGDRTLKLKSVFAGKESVLVGAGKFSALTFICKADYLDAQGRKFAEIWATYWYAPEVKGMVKIDVRAALASGEQYLRATLDSFPARP